MGNVLNLMPGIAALEHRHRTRRRSQGRTADDQFEPWHALVFRAVSYQAGCNAIHRKGVAADSRFQLLSILICISMSARIRRRGPICDKGDDRSKLCGVLVCGAISDRVYRELICEKGVLNDLFENLPEDVLSTIFSKLPLDEAVRTSAVSRRWRFLWTVCPKLSFDGTTVRCKSTYRKEQHIQKFIDSVYAVLLQCHGRVVEELAIKFDFDTMLVGHLNGCASFVVSSRIKFLTLDLAPERFVGRDDRYLFPFQLLDSGSISRLQKIHLSFGHLQPPAGFSGFPNLRKLELNLVNVSGKDLQDMLSNCCNLEWLSIVRCHLYDELKVNGPLPHLLYLQFSFCEITKIALHVVELTTFVYKGRPVCIDLGKSSRLESADISFYEVTLEDATTLLANVFTHAQNLTFDTSYKPPEMPCQMHSPCKFSHLRHLKLMLQFENDVNSLHLISFLMSAPFIEILEMDLTVCPSICMEYVPIKGYPGRTYKYLKNVCMTAFRGSRGQLEFLLYIVENAPALEFLTIDRSYKLVKCVLKDAKKEAEYVDSLHRTARRYLRGKISPKCSLRLL